MNVVIIKYNAGNIRSVDFALRRLGVEAVLTDDHDLIRSADKVIFPGVGEAGTTMKYLRGKKLDRVIKELTRPVLGICLGMQLMCAYSEEGQTGCLGIFQEKVSRFSPGKKVPHMGWNRLEQTGGSLFDAKLSHQYMYFVHSYYVPVGTDTTAVTDYMGYFSAALEKGNFFATQFHPEKSGGGGEKILLNFLKL
jgi:glutamine amidotransferase